MSLADFLIMLGIAALLGVISQRLLGFRMGGWILTTILGFLGVLLGRWMYYQFGGGWDPVKILVFDRPFPLMWCLIGGVSTTLIAGWLARQRRPGRDKK